MQMVISQSKNNNVTFLQLNKYIKKQNICGKKAELWSEFLHFQDAYEQNPKAEAL